MESYFCLGSVELEKIVHGHRAAMNVKHGFAVLHMKTLHFEIDTKNMEEIKAHSQTVMSQS